MKAEHLAEYAGIVSLYRSNYPAYETERAAFAKRLGSEAYEAVWREHNARQSYKAALRAGIFPTLGNLPNDK